MLNEPIVVRVNEIQPVKVDNARGTWIRVLFPSSLVPTFIMRIFEMEPEGHIDAHSHPWEHEIFVLEGKLRVRVEDKVFDLDPETAIYIPPNKVHEYWNLSSGRTRFICVIPIKPSV